MTLIDKTLKDIDLSENMSLAEKIKLDTYIELYNKYYEKYNEVRDDLIYLVAYCESFIDKKPKQMIEILKKYDKSY